MCMVCFAGEFHIYSDTTSGEISTEEEEKGMLTEGMDTVNREKGKTLMDDSDDISSDEESVGREYRIVSDAKASTRLIFSSPEEERLEVRSLEEEESDLLQRSGRSIWFKRRKTLSPSN